MSCALVSLKVSILQNDFRTTCLSHYYSLLGRLVFSSGKSCSYSPGNPRPFPRRLKNPSPSPMHRHQNALYVSGVLVSANIAATTMSQAIGAAVASVRVANLLGSLAIMMFLLFGGFLLNRDQVPWYCTWIADLSYFNYAYEALAVSPLLPTCTCWMLACSTVECFGMSC